MLDGTVEQIIDSTPMLGAAATQDTVRLVRHGVRKLLDAVRASDEQAGNALDDGLQFDYQKPGEKPDCRWREKAERERMLTLVAQDAERALVAVEQSEGLLEDEAVKAAHQLLRELIGQDFEIDEDGIPRLHRGTAAGRIISTVDQEMRHGRKSSQARFDGYKLSASVTNTSEPLIMAVHVAPGGETDGPQAKHLIDTQPAGRRPERILGDTAYGNGPVRAELAERDVEVLAPVPEGKVEEGVLGKHDFQIDMDANTVTCPGGHTVPISTSKKGYRSAGFSRVMCRHCPLKERCCPGRPRRQIQINEHEGLLQAARQTLQDPGARGASPPDQTPDRTAARSARSPLRRPQEPLHRQRQSTIAGRLGGRAGQPQPDRAPAGAAELTRTGTNTSPIAHVPSPAPLQTYPWSLIGRIAEPTSSGDF